MYNLDPLAYILGLPHVNSCQYLVTQENQLYLLVTRQVAQLICLGFTINNIGVHVTINRSIKLHYIICT